MFNPTPRVTPVVEKKVGVVETDSTSSSSSTTEVVCTRNPWNHYRGMRGRETSVIGEGTKERLRAYVLRRPSRSRRDHLPGSITEGTTEGDVPSST